MKEWVGHILVLLVISKLTRKTEQEAISRSHSNVDHDYIYIYIYIYIYMWIVWFIYEYRAKYQW